MRYGRKRCYRYLWVAVSRVTRQVLGFVPGDRSERSLWQLWFSLPGDYRRKLVYSDCYEAYATFFRPWQHRSCAKGSGKTNLVEGLNNKWRNRVSGLVRKTVCVQSLCDLQRRLWIVIYTHNQLCLKQIKKLLASTG